MAISEPALQRATKGKFEMKSLIYPTPNLNGTPRERLLEQTVAVIDALRAVNAAMGEAMPHGRDYVNSAIDGENGGYAARDAFGERRDIIKNMEREFQKQAEALVR